MGDNQVLMRGRAVVVLRVIVVAVGVDMLPDG